MEENNIKNDGIRDQSIIDSAEDTGSLFKKLLPLLFALVLAILLFLFFNKGSNATQTEMQTPVNNTPLDSSAMPAIDTNAVALDSTVVDSTK
jgi:flagellar basal body-associated protein FliL